MDVSYKKDLRHNYLVISKPDNSDDEAYCVNMLQANSIDGIIRPEPRTIDSQVFYYYDITAKQSIDTIYVKSTINYEQLKSLFTRLADLIECTYEYLLNENDLILVPDYVYIELASSLVYIGYLPGYNKDIERQLVTLIEFFMNKVDYNDKAAVLYIYNLHAVCRNEGFCFNKLLAAIREEGADNSTKKENKKGSSLRAKKDYRQEDTAKTDEEEASREEYKPIRQIPVMMEKISQEREAYYYPLRTYIYSGACILGAIMVLLICLNMKIIYTPIGNRVDYGKLVALLLILIIIVGYLMKIIWNKNNRLTKIISRQEYIDPRDEHNQKPQAERTAEHLKTEHENPLPKRKAEAIDKANDIIDSTVLLNAEPPSGGCYLEPENLDDYKVIHIRDFPFIIGKQNGKVDYLLDRDVVSRYHVKITKEEETYYITDLNSTNGTTLNDMPLPCYQRYAINKGDLVSIAGIRYSFHI